MKLKRSLLFLYQKLTRGWSDKDTWNLDATIAKFTLPRLLRFRELEIGYVEPLTETEWDATLSKMIRAMELVIYDSEGAVLNDDMEKEISEGLELFGKYFRYLWW